ncbi:hypothetical protein [Anaerorhabdus sp.]|uniref:hypothetical protein n=1 Tax=Anaerorhabdus sp. TaxID=1872524 RepID=UPI002FCB517C
MTESIMIHNSHNVSNLVFHFVSSVGKHTSEKAIQQYVKSQGKENEFEQIYLHV